MQEAKHERADPIEFQLYEILDHAKLANGDRNEISVCLRQRSWRGGGGGIKCKGPQEKFLE